MIWLLVSWASAQEQPLLDAVGEEAVRQGLAALLIDEADLAWTKDYVNGYGEPRDRWRVAGIDQALLEPLSVPEDATRLSGGAEAAAGSPTAAISEGARALGRALPASAHQGYGEARNAKQLARYAASEAAGLRGQMEAALGGASPEVVAATLARFDQEDGSFEAWRAGVQAELAASDAVDWSGLFGAAQHAAALAEDLEVRAKALESWPREPLRVEQDGVVVMIGTEGPDRFDGDATIVIDPGGDDVHAWTWSILALAVDLGGDDTWSTPGAIRGVSVTIDSAGDDTWMSKDVGTGGALFGVGVVVDRAGRDVYRGGLLVQGAASHGIGALADLEGDDRYTADAYAQGFGGVRGYGAAVDLSGDDTWRAGGRIPANSAYPELTTSMSQGFGFGHRPIAGGGIGLLDDVAGNDTYGADTFAQGGSYWLARGYLVDRAGNDDYLATHYAQGSAVHLGVAGLFDLSGDDHHSILGLGFGSAHDYSVGWLVDREGDDYYGTTGGGGFGMGLTNAAAFFVDEAGDDRQVLLDRGAYLGRFDRLQGSVSLAVDLGGTDVRTPGMDGSIDRPWMFGAWIDHGPGLDLPQSVGPASVPAQEQAGGDAGPTGDAAGRDAGPTGGAADPDAVARVVALCDEPGPAQDAARAAIVAPADLSPLLPALTRGAYMDGYCLDAVVAGLRGKEDGALRDVLITAASDVMNARDQRWIVQWLGALGPSKPAYVAVSRQAASEDPFVRAMVAQVLPDLGQGDPDGVLARLAADPAEMVRAVAVLSLGRVGAPVATVVPLLRDPSFLVRFNAAGVIEAHPDRKGALVAVRSAWDAGGFDRAVIRRLHLELLGRMGDRALLEQVAASDADPWAQWQAKRLLAGETAPWRR